MARKREIIKTLKHTIKRYTRTVDAMKNGTLEDGLEEYYSTTCKMCEIVKGCAAVGDKIVCPLNGPSDNGAYYECCDGAWDRFDKATDNGNKSEAIKACKLIIARAKAELEKLEG